jgi:aspartyl-tRNA(Asn)/glutamyl-tRNA(Gln) amidotransferase subunit C
MMQIDETLILKLEKLARLQLSAADKTKFADDLTNILQMVDTLQTLDTTGVEPLVYMTDAENILRDDVVANQLTQSEALKNAPKHDGQYFRVPKVIG